MVDAVVDMVTRGSIAPGVQAGSGRPPWLRQPAVFVLGEGAQAAVRMVGTGRATDSVGAVVGAGVGAALASTVVGTAVGGTAVGEAPASTAVGTAVDAGV